MCTDKEGSTVKIIDFGAAKILNPLKKVLILMSGIIDVLRRHMHIHGCTVPHGYYYELMADGMIGVCIFSFIKRLELLTGTPSQ